MTSGKWILILMIIAVVVVIHTRRDIFNSSNTINIAKNQVLVLSTILLFHVFIESFFHELPTQAELLDAVKVTIVVELHVLFDDGLLFGSEMSLLLLLLLKEQTVMMMMMMVMVVRIVLVIVAGLIRIRMMMMLMMMSVVLML